MSQPNRPTNTLVTPLLTDLYQITMTYAHWKNNRHEDSSIFELFFRKNPFGGEFTIFAGLDECLKHLASYKFSESDIAYLKTVPALQHCESAFFDWLLNMNTSQVTVRAIPEGSVVFPRVPLMIIEGPLAICQLLETTLLTLVNYPSLLTTNAARMVIAAAPPLSLRGAGRDGVTTPPEHPAQCFRRPVCIEFGLRRAQGPDGGFSASKYSAIGGFVATSNVQAGKLCGLNIAGTHAHSFVQAYSGFHEVADNSVVDKNTGQAVKLLPLVVKYRDQLAKEHHHHYATTNEGELSAFIAYATAFPDTFLCLIDTYETLESGLLNFILVALVLDDLGYKPMGIRLDSGDLAYLSMECAKTFQTFCTERPFFSELSIVASNDINEEILHALNKQDHAITTYGIGTNLVTCQAQPALGCVYKLVEISGKPRMKLSQDINKVLIPGRKKAYRLSGKDGRFILDVMVAHHEKPPAPGERILCRHPFISRKRAAVTPTKVEQLDVLVFDHGKIVPGANRSFSEAKEAVVQQMKTVRADILRYKNPTPYKVSISDELFNFLHELWQSETPVAELS